MDRFYWFGSTRSASFIIQTEPLSEPSPLLPEPPSSDFSLGERLQSVYPLLDLVFSQLTYKDLLTASAVNKVWRATALKHLKQRQQVAWFSCTDDGNSRRTSDDRLMFRLERSSNLLHSNPKFCFVFTSIRNFSINTKLDVEYQKNPEPERFLTTEYLQKKVLGYPFRETLILGSTDINSHLDVSKRAESETEARSLFESLTLPEIPNTRVIYITGPHHDEYNLSSIYVKDTEKIAGLLVFCSKEEERHVRRFLKYLLEGLVPKEVPVAGGVIFGTKKHFLGPEHCPQTKSICCYNVSCVAFLQLKHAETKLLLYSLVISEGDCFATQMKKFQEKVVMRSHSAAFRFSCSAKNGSRQLETFIFNQYFPNTPVIGLDVYGEIGWDTVLVDDDAEAIPIKKFRRFDLPPVCHQWSTTFMLITWDN